MTTKVSIFRDKRKKRPWIVRWFGWPDPVTGEQRRYSKSFRLKSEAESFRADKMAEFKEGNSRDPIRETTLGEFCRDWMEVNRSDLGPETVRLYENTVQRLLAHFPSDMPIMQITRADTQKFVARLARFGGSKKPLAKATKLRTLRQCRTLFDDACEWDYLKVNPFKPKNPRRRDRQRAKLKSAGRRWYYLTPAEYLKLLQAAPSLRWRCLYAVAYTAGLRRAELANLQWADIDFEARQLHVRPREENSALPPFRIKDDEPRTVPVPKHTLDLLVEFREKKHEQGSRMVLNPFALLSDREYEGIQRRWKQCQERKTPWTSRHYVNNWLTNFRRHVKKAEIQPEGRLALHDLRKACIQNWADCLPPKATQEFAGHADAKTTMEYYNQTTAEHTRQAADKIDEMLRKSDAQLTPKAKFGS